MSYLVGPISGALVAGGVYYGFSNMIHSSSERHRKDLHLLSERLHSAPSFTPAPPPASERIVRSPFTSFLKGRWNQEVAGLVSTVRGLGVRSAELGRKALYGTDITPTKRH